MTKTEDIFNIDAPIKTARKRLDKWLTRERLYLPPSARKKAAVKLARLFENENSDNPLLYQNFLTMIVDSKEENADDIGIIESELRHIIHSAYPQKRLIFLCILVVALASALSFSIMYNGRIVVFPTDGTINSSQEKVLKNLVSDIVALESQNGHALSHSEIWNELKTTLSIKSYRDMPAIDFEKGKTLLESRLEKVVKIQN